MAGELSGFAAALRSNGMTAEVTEKAYRIAHSLHGAGTLYGYPCVSELGSALEKLVAGIHRGEVRASAGVAELVDSCAAALREAAGPDRGSEAVAARLTRLAWLCECAAHGDAANTQPPAST